MFKWSLYTQCIKWGIEQMLDFVELDCVIAMIVLPLTFYALCRLTWYLLGVDA